MAATQGINQQRVKVLPVKFLLTGPNNLLVQPCRGTKPIPAKRQNVVRRRQSNEIRLNPLAAKR
jgi:hypothetical protein